MRNKGFTLVELLFVTAIIGVILSLLAPALVAVKRRARAIQCMSRLRQVGQLVAAYSNEHGYVIPYVTIGPEAQAHPQHLYQPSTGVPSLSHFIDMLGEYPELAQCPADNGCAGQSYYPTRFGRSCFDDWGQSMLYNSSCYREERAPGYDPRFEGKLYGANAVLREDVTRDAEFMLAADFWPHWHFGASMSPGSHYYTNILFFDYHVEGRHYETANEAMAYLNWDGLRRWWIRDPRPFVPPR